MLLATFFYSKKTAQEQATAQAQTNGDEIDPYLNVVFTFNEKVVNEIQQDRWDIMQYVKFMPAVRGKFKWGNDRKLTFSPLEPFQSSTVFAADLRPGASPCLPPGRAPGRKSVPYAIPAHGRSPGIFWPFGAGCGHGGQA